MRERLEATGEPGASLVLAAAEAGRGKDALPIGLACGVLFGEAEPRASLREAAVRLEPLVGGARVDPRAGRAMSEAARRVVQALDPVAARATQSKTADLLAELRAADAAALSPALALGLEARMADAASALAAVALSGAAKEIPRAWERVQYAVEHDRAAEHRERTERLLMAARLATWFMQERHDMKRGLWRFHHQPVDDRNPDRAEPLAVTKTKADIEGPLVDCGSERSKDDLRRIGYPVVARERSNACAVDRRDRRKNVQVYNARNVVGTRPGRLFLLPSPLGLAHRLLPRSMLRAQP